MLQPIEIGKRIYDRRMELGLTLQEVADRVGVQNSTIYRYEKGEIKRIKLPVVEAIASALQISPGYLIGREDKKNILDEGWAKRKIPPKISDKSVKIVTQIDSSLYNNICTLAEQHNRSFENELEYILYWATENEMEELNNQVKGGE